MGDSLGFRSAARKQGSLTARTRANALQNIFLFIYERMEGLHQAVNLFVHFKQIINHTKVYVFVIQPNFSVSNNIPSIFLLVNFLRVENHRANSPRAAMTLKWILSDRQIANQITYRDLAPN